MMAYVKGYKWRQSIHEVGTLMHEDILKTWCRHTKAWKHKVDIEKTH